MDLQKEIYNRFCLIEENSRITFDKVNEYSSDEMVLDKSRLDIEMNLKLQIKSGKYSQFIINQLARHRCNLGERFGDKIEYYNASEICLLINQLEKGIYKHKVFIHTPLIGFSKIHHSSYSGRGYSIVRNIREFWFKKGKIKKEKMFEFQKVVDVYGGQGIVPIMNSMHMKAMIQKSKDGQLKGEWLIYKVHNDCLFYICLATHEEGDENIYQNKILPCLEEFPELFKIETTN